MHILLVGWSNASPASPATTVLLTGHTLGQECKGAVFLEKGKTPQKYAKMGYFLPFFEKGTLMCATIARMKDLQYIVVKEKQF